MEILDKKIKNAENDYISLEKAGAPTDVLKLQKIYIEILKEAKSKKKDYIWASAKFNLITKDII